MTGRLRPVPDSPPRALAYIRVSNERDEGISPELQRIAIEDHCARAGYTIIDTLADLDLTGRFWKRRQVEQAIQRIESGDADVLVVWKISRVARNRRDWAVAVDRVEVAGGKLESATEPIDVSTSSGRLARGMLAEFAAFESDRIGDVWREVHARRNRQGLPANGKARFGYRVVDGLHRPDPDTGPVLADLYRRYVAGETFYSLTVWINQQGIQTVPGYSRKGPGPWSPIGLRQMLDTGFGAGYITVRGARQRGIHEPVIDEQTWTAYQAARIGRRTLKRSERSPYLLSSLTWCGCGSRMGCGRYGRSRITRLRCYESTAASGPRHPAGYVQLAPVEAAVRAWVERLAGQVDESTDVGLAQAAKATRRRHDAKQLAREVIELDKAIGRLVANDAKLPELAQRAGLDVLMRDRAQLEERRLVAEAESTALDPARLAADLVGNWDLYGTEQLRAALKRLIARVVVDGRDGTLRVEVVAN